VAFGLGKAVAVARVAVVTDTTGLKSGLNKAEAEVQGFGARGGKALKAFGAAFAASAGIGLAALGKQSVDAASNLEEQLNKAATVFAGSERQVISWSETMAESFGVSQRAALEATGTFGNMLVPMGFAREEAAGMSMRMVELAADMASFNNASPEETLDALRAGLAGETEPLRRFGVFLNDARLKQEALSMGLYSGVGALDANTKAQATYSVILKDTGDTQGDFARTSESLANQQRILRAQIEEAAAAIGQKLLPVVADLANWLTKELIPGVTKFTEKVDGAVEAMGGWDFALKDLLPDVKGLDYSLIDLGNDIDKHIIGAFRGGAREVKNAGPSLLTAVENLAEDVGDQFEETLTDSMVGAVQRAVRFAIAQGGRAATEAEANRAAGQRSSYQPGANIGTNIVAGATLGGGPGVGTHNASIWQDRNAVDLLVRQGAPVYAAAGGTIVRTGGSTQDKGRYGGLKLTIVGLDGNQYFYTHLSARFVEDGDTVTAGQIIGKSGTANGTPHVHFAVMRGDPRDYLRIREESLDTTSPETAARESAPPRVRTSTKPPKLPTVRVDGAAFQADAKAGIVRMAIRIAGEEGIPADIVLSLIYTESRFNPKASNNVAGGHFGLTQISAALARGMVSPYAVEGNLRRGARYLREMYNRFRSWAMALAAYNAGPNNTGAGQGYSTDVRRRAGAFRPVVNAARSGGPADIPAPETTLSPAQNRTIGQLGGTSNRAQDRIDRMSRSGSDIRWNPRTGQYDVVTVEPDIAGLRKEETNLRTKVLPRLRKASQRSFRALKRALRARRKDQQLILYLRKLHAAQRAEFLEVKEIWATLHGTITDLTGEAQPDLEEPVDEELGLDAGELILGGPGVETDIYQEAAGLNVTATAATPEELAKVGQISEVVGARAELFRGGDVLRYDPATGKYIWVSLQADIDGLKKFRDYLQNEVLPTIDARIKALRSRLKSLRGKKKMDQKLIASTQATLDAFVAERAEIVALIKELTGWIGDLTAAANAGPPPEKENVPADSGGAAVSGEAGGGLTAADVAAQTQANVLGFLGGARDLRGLASNIAERSFAGTLGLGPGSPTAGATITVVNNYAAGPPDPLSQSKGLEFELRALLN
jgi:murein DD-endopeptidase MepM/ murein hydrolase activator NlpD